jgi:tetratricopeptide (TPR) repeat protein
LAEDRSASSDDGNEKRAAALTRAWQSALDPGTAVAARALIAKLHLRYAGYRQAVNALTQPGPWQSDPLCRNRLASALLESGEKSEAIRLARENLKVDPLDHFARSVLWRAKAESDDVSFVRLLKEQPEVVLDLAEEYWDLMGDHWEPALQLLGAFFTDPVTGKPPRMDYTWQQVTKLLALLRLQHAKEFLPHKLETSSVLADALEMWAGDNDGKVNLYLGHLLFHLGRHAEGRALWQKAAELGAEPVIAYRALGMAAKTLDSDLPAARSWLEKANQADPKDAIVARDLARVLFDLADKADDDEKRAMIVQAGDCLRSAFEEGKGRSDFVSLLARSYSRLGDHAATAKLLDSVRITIWEGAREAHDLFEEAHLELGDEHLKTGRSAEALIEFNRALEYPANLATGRLENAREAHIHYRRGNALAALDRRDEALAAWRLAVEEPASGDAKNEEARRLAREAIERSR